MNQQNPMNRTGRAESASLEAMTGNVIVAALQDLFFLAPIRTAVSNRGAELVWAQDAARARESLAAAALVILDLNAKPLQPLALIEAAKAAGVPVLAFVPHVQVDLRQQALDAGADAVVARSTFVSQLPELLGRWA
jgi:DNA-binding response OmpR family regulator